MKYVILSALFIAFSSSTLQAEGPAVTFTNTLGANAGVVEKACADDPGAAIECFRVKRDAVRREFSAGDKMHEKPAVLLLARFLGQVRSKRVPNYSEFPESQNMLQSIEVSGKRVFNPQTSTDPEVKKAYDRAFAEWQYHNNNVELQTLLKHLDREFTPLLLRACAQLSASDPSNVDFLKQISEAAHLTEEERGRVR